MRILITTDTIGGVWTFTKELCQELLEQGHTVALVSFGQEPNDEQNNWCARTLRHNNSNFVVLNTAIPLEWMSDNSLSYVAAEPVLLKLADSFAPDLFHSNQYCFGKLPIPVPKLITAHSDVLSWADCCGHQNLESSPWLERYKKLVEEGLEIADALTAPTGWMLKALKRNFPDCPPSKVILNGRTLPATPCGNRRPLQGLCVGRLWDKGKNLAALTNSRMPIPVYAIGERQLGRAVAPESSGSVTLLGPMIETDLLCHMRQSSIYIAPSIYEPFGLAPLEAALCGCALVLHDIPSFHEVWKDAAIYFRGSNHLIDILCRLKSSPDCLLSARKRAHRRARRLTATRMTSAYLDLYRELAETKRCSATLALESYA